MIYEYENEPYQILETMEQMGGSFIKQLAKLYRLADPQNQMLLEIVFDKYFNEYDDMTSLGKKRCRTTETDS